MFHVNYNVMFLNLVLLCFCFFNVLVPSSAPVGLNATDSSSTSLNVSWTPLHLKYREGVLLGYNISYEFVNSSLFEHRNGSLIGYWLCYGAETSFCDVQGLELHTNYSLSVAAFTHVGLGPWAQEIVQATSFFGQSLQCSLYFFFT